METHLNGGSIGSALIFSPFPGALERVGEDGKVVHIYQTGNPQSQAVSSMNFPTDIAVNLSTLNMYHLRSLEQGEDITAMHQKPEGQPNANVDGKVPFRQRLREDSVKSHSLLNAGSGMDALIIACKQHPTNLLLSLIKYLAPSRPFAVYSPYKEPLLHAYMAVKDTKRALMVTLSGMLRLLF